MDLDKQGKFAAIGTFYLTIVLVVIGSAPLYLLLYPPAPSKSVVAAHPERTMPSIAWWVFLGGMVLTASLHVVAAVLQRQAAKLSSALPGAIGTERGVPAGHETSGRIIVTVTPEELVQPFEEEGRTTLDASMLTERYLNKWLRWSGPVKNVSPNGWVSGDISNQSISFGFDAEWIERVSMLRPGDTITVEGKIRSIEYKYVILVSCELREVTRPAASPSLPTGQPSPQPPRADS
jgi:hypothetical protein